MCALFFIILLLSSYTPVFFSLDITSRTSTPSEAPCISPICASIPRREDSGQLAKTHLPTGRRCGVNRTPRPCALGTQHFSRACLLWCKGHVHGSRRLHCVTTTSFALCQWDSLLSSRSWFILLCWYTHYHKKHNHIHHDNLQHKIVMVNILHRALHKAAVCLVVWPTNPRPYKVRKKDCVWPKSQLLKATAKTWLEWSVFLLGPLLCAFVFLIPLVLCYLSSDDAFKCILCGPQRFTSQQKTSFCYASSTNDQWTGMWSQGATVFFQEATRQCFRIHEIGSRTRGKA